MALMARRRNRSKRSEPSISEDETSEALRQYNAAMQRAADERRAVKAARRADTKRREAAEALQRLRDDPAASPDDLAAAEAHYRDMVDEWNRVRR